MPIRTILVPVANADSSKPTIETALIVASMFSSHIDALHVRIDPKETLPLLGEGMSGTLIQDMIEFAEKESDERAKKAFALFKGYCDGRKIPLVDKASMSKFVTAGWTEVSGREDDHVSIRGRLTDLIVVGRPLADSDTPSPTTLNAALFETGRAVLVAPPMAPEVLGKKVVIFWRGSTEASRAIAAGMPFIWRAETVKIVSALADQATRASAEGLATYLAWHGVNAEVETLTATDGKAVGSRLLDSAQKFQADLLVMGAYTHSRVRQLILGGVTQKVLAEATIPVVMAH